MIFDKSAKEPKKVINVKFIQLKNCIEVFLFKEGTQASEPAISQIPKEKYHMYVVYENGVVLVKDVFGVPEQLLILDE